MSWANRHHILVASLLLAVSVAMTVPHARAKPFWHDEIYTILMSRLPSVVAMWTAALDGVDLSPPLTLWLTRAVHEVTGVGHVSTRLPALDGFYLAILLVFALLRRRVGAAAAISGPLFLLVTAAPRYASEARAYGVMLALFAAALYCWMEAARGRQRRIFVPALALALAASIWNHYYGALAFAPVAAGEAARLVRNRRADPAIAAALGVALLAAVPLWPLMQAASSQGATFWATATRPAQVVESYRFLLQPLLDAPFVLAGVLLALIWACWRRAHDGAEASPDLPFHEWIAVLVGAAIPMLGFLLGRFVTGAFAPRYILSGAVALAIAVPLVVSRGCSRNTRAEILMCVTLIVAALTALVRAWYPAPVPFIHPVASRPVLSHSLRSAGPTVVSSSLQFLQLWYYAPPELKHKLRYLASPQEALRRTGSDTIDRGYAALGRTMTVPVVDYASFVGAEEGFRVYAAGSGWLLDALQDAGASVDLIAAEPGGRLYFVRMPRNSRGAPF
ncbi:MAG: glycosyltransferase family 39 protein [Acidobacteriota bacterium]|nr:glycosyltransferase family 39 protein [Acidobacteriota bacterium]